jgi:hypothetical protein
MPSRESGNVEPDEHKEDSLLTLRRPSATKDLVEAGESSRYLSLYCPLCANNTQHLDAISAAVLLGVSRSAVYLWMKHGVVHWLALPRGVRVICHESLCELTRSRPWIKPPMAKTSGNLGIGA